jgi:hypothetical protein
MLKGGVIMDVMNPEQARIAEKAGAVAGSESVRINLFLFSLLIFSLFSHGP